MFHVKRIGTSFKVFGPNYKSKTFRNRAQAIRHKVYKEKEFFSEVKSELPKQDPIPVVELTPDPIIEEVPTEEPVQELPVEEPKKPKKAKPSPKKKSTSKKKIK